MSRKTEHRDMRGLIRDLRLVADKMELRRHHIIIPFFLSLFAAVTSASMLALLAPLARGIATGDFSLPDRIPLPPIIESFALQDTMQMDFAVVVLLISVLYVIKILVQFALNMYAETRNLRLLQTLRMNMLHRCLLFGKLYFDHRGQGELQTIVGYADQMMNLVRLFDRFLSTTFKLVAYLVVLFLLSWRFTLVLVLLLPLLHYSIAALLRRIREQSAHLNTVSKFLGRSRFNLLNIADLIKVTAQEQPALRRYSLIEDESRLIKLKIARLSQLIGPIQELVVLILALALLGGFVFTQSFNVEDLAVFAVYMYIAKNTFPLLRSYGSMRQSWANIHAPLEEVVTVFTDDGKHIIPEGDRELAKIEREITIDKLSFSYGATPVLQELSFKVEAGKMTAVVGRTGAGKTTLLHLLLRLYDCPPGTILIDGVDIRDFSLASLRQQVAFVSQQPLLFHDSLEANLLFGLSETPSPERLAEAVEAACFAEVIERAPNALQTLIGDRGIQLSGGERQRLEIARALLKQAPLLLLDEATSALDSTTERSIQHSMDRLLQNRTAIVVAHRLSTIKHADTIVVIDEGRVREQGTFQELIDADGLFARMWSDQSFY